MKQRKRTYTKKGYRYYHIPSSEENIQELQRLEMIYGEPIVWTYREPSDKKYKAFIAGNWMITWFYGETPEELLQNFGTWTRLTREDNEIALIEQGHKAQERTRILDHITYCMRLDLLTQIALQKCNEPYGDLP